ncbi:MAG: 4Fe-4S dicluster domain-containing protein [Chthoniobacterales bacterium]
MPEEPKNLAATLERAELPHLFEALRTRGFQVVGPTMRDGAIVYDTLTGPEDLPAGWTDEQDGGTYRLKKRSDAALFGYVVGPHSWKKFLFPPEERLFRARRTTDGFEMMPEKTAAPRLAFLGVRSCELHAIAVQDKVFLGGQFVDPSYQARRENIFIIAVNCGQAGGTCFCVSMQTGPKVTGGFDLALTEILDGGRHYFVIESGSAAGAELLADLPHRPAEETEISAAAAATARAVSQMGRTLETDGIKELLYRNLEHPRWDDVAARCLSCANCTLVCPTCFCSNVEDTTDLTGEHAERWRKWDSCFTVDFSHLAGGPVRSSVKSRYRQWLTHKLATWIDQFGTSGCVGCGRCITWCPVAIDLTEEVRVIRKSEPAHFQPNEPEKQ